MNPKQAMPKLNTLNKKYWFTRLYKNCQGFLPIAHKQKAFDRFFESDYGKPVLESVKRQLTESVRYKLTNRTKNIKTKMDLWLAFCAYDPGMLIEFCEIPGTLEFLRSEPGKRFLERLGKRVGRYADDAPKPGDKPRSKVQERLAFLMEKPDIYMYHFWTLCHGFLPPLAFLTDTALAQLFNIVFRECEMEEFDSDGIRKWRKRWELKSPGFFLIREMILRADSIHLTWYIPRELGKVGQQKTTAVQTRKSKNRHLSACEPYYAFIAASNGRHIEDCCN